jgi:carbonic anhydrase/acetyltransferase-like protein (isoleucine patch superfamily)
MLLEHKGAVPKIDPTARIAPNAVLCGQVTIGANSSIGFGAVLSAESGPITVGSNCVIMDTATVRGLKRNPVRIGNNVLVGPRAYLTGCEVEDNVFLATGATVFNGARIGTRATVRINGIVHIRTVLPPDAVVPLNWIAVGDPVEILPPNEHERIWAIQRELDFPKYVFGIDGQPPIGKVMSKVMPRYARALQAHRADRLLSETEW